MLKESDLKVVHYKKDIREIQDKDMERIIRHKALAAYKELFRPVLVEHTGLYLSDYGDMPGGLTQIFFDSLTLCGFSELFAKERSTRAVAKSMFGFCDGKTICTAYGELTGKVIFPPCGTDIFQWDPIFVPDGYTKTFAEMGPEEKNKISMRRKAFERISLEIKGASL